LQDISESIIQWYKNNKRDLPWRQTTDPYSIWLSEVILQQTRVIQGLSYYLKFIEIFPNVEKLATASEDQVLELWQGLGYYSRARNLHAAAKHINEELKGQFPRNYDGLIKLKGIGDYTASAIASFAFHEDKVVVDGNVIRVISRLYGIVDDVRQPKVIQKVKAFAEELLPKGSSYLFNQGIMELGALICTPQNPKCNLCPVVHHCQAFKLNLKDKIPFKSKMKERRVRFLNYILLKVEDEIFLSKRGPGDIWEGLYEPILIEADRAYQTVDDFFSSISFNLGPKKILSSSIIPTKKHLLTHQELWVNLCVLELAEKPKDLIGIWVSGQKIQSTPKSIIISKLLSELEAGQLYLAFK
jgi:A/G-specific adenine glycosylase